MKKFVFLMLNLCFLSYFNNTFALSYVPMLLSKNLKNYTYAEQQTLTLLLKSSFATAKQDDAYLLSMPLLASAEQGDESLYRQILPKFEIALARLSPSQSTYKAWLLGRSLLASQSISDDSNFISMQAALNALLNDKKLTIDNYSAWAIGYLAASSQSEYVAFKKRMLKSGNDLTRKYYENKDKTKAQALASDALWAWVLDLKAAANVRDKSTYQFILKQIKKLSGQKTVADAITHGLTQTDYPAWALGITQLAAATMHDDDLFHSLSSPLQNAIIKAQKLEYKNEQILGKINLELAQLRWKELDPIKESK